MKSLLNTMNFWVAVLTVVSLVWYHGFAHALLQQEVHTLWLGLALTYFVFQFVYRVRVSDAPYEFIKSNWVEGLIYLLATALVLQITVGRFNSEGTAPAVADAQRLAVHLMLLLISGVEMIAATSRSTFWKLPLPILLITSYVILILVGSVILHLPMMLNGQVEPSYFQALFTAVSASCVTGLATVNIADYYSRSGHLVILFLIQLGGLNILAFATYFVARFLHVDRATLQGEAVQEVLSLGSFTSAKRLLQRILAVAILFEGLGAAWIYYGSDYIASGPNRAFHAVFHSVSAFNNAGFTIIDGGLTNAAVQGLWGFHTAIAVLVILGGLGFATIMQVPVFIRSMGRTGLSFNSRVSLLMAAALIGAGTLLILLMEWNADVTFAEQLHQAFFQSVTARTAGFNTAPIGMFGLPTLYLMMMLMFIGASPASTGGGIKTTTFYALIRSLGRSTRAFDESIVVKAKKLLLFGILTVVCGTAVMFATEERFTITQLLFEQVSAFGTVGLSTGITPQLGRASLAVIMVTMFIGRVGPLALAYLFVVPKNTGSEQETLLIG